MVVAETVESPVVGLRMLMGGTLARFITPTWVREWPAVVNISAHCWVLKEHASVSFWEIKTTRLDLQLYRWVCPGLVLSRDRVLCVV